MGDDGTGKCAFGPIYRAILQTPQGHLHFSYYAYGDWQASAPCDAGEMATLQPAQQPMSPDSAAATNEVRQAVDAAGRWPPASTQVWKPVRIMYDSISKPIPKPNSKPMPINLTPELKYI